MSKTCALFYDLNRDGYTEQVCFDTGNFKLEKPNFTVAFGTSKPDQFVQSTEMIFVSPSSGDTTYVFAAGLPLVFKQGGEFGRSGGYVTRQFTVQFDTFSLEPLFLRCPIELAAQACFFVAAPEGVAEIK